MTVDILTDLGEEYGVKNGFEATFSIGIYNDSTDGLSDTSDVGDITTEPTNTNYSRQSVAFTAADISGNWGVDNDALFSFDFSDQSASETVDAAFIVVNFQAEDTSDGSATDHLLGNAGMDSSQDIGAVSSIEYAAGDLQLTLD